MKLVKIMVLIIIFFTFITSNALATASKHKCIVLDIQNDGKKSILENQKKIAQIYNLFDAWRNAIKEGNAKKVASMVTTDAEFWSNLAPPIKGRTALEEAF